MNVELVMLQLCKLCYLEIPITIPVEDKISIKLWSLFESAKKKNVQLEIPLPKFASHNVMKWFSSILRKITLRLLLLSTMLNKFKEDSHQEVLEETIENSIVIGQD
jgi:hypothetical protein